MTDHENLEVKADCILTALLKNQKKLEEVNEDLKDFCKSLYPGPFLKKNLVEIKTFFANEYTKSEITLFFDCFLRKYLIKKSTDISKQQQRDDSTNEIISLLKVIRLKNPNLLKIYQIEISSNKCEILMEWGIGTLHDIIDFINVKRTYYEGIEDDFEESIEKQKEIIEKIPIYHNDIHELNMLVREDFSIILCDYGAAKSENKQDNNEIDLSLLSKALEGANPITRKYFMENFYRHMILKILKQNTSSEEQKIEQIVHEFNFFGDFLMILEAREDDYIDSNKINNIQRAIKALSSAQISLRKADFENARKEANEGKEWADEIGKDTENYFLIWGPKAKENLVELKSAVQQIYENQEHFSCLEGLETSNAFDELKSMSQNFGGDNGSFLLVENLKEIEDILNLLVKTPGEDQGSNLYDEDLKKVKSRLQELQKSIPEIMKQQKEALLFQYWLIVGDIESEAGDYKAAFGHYQKARNIFMQYEDQSNVEDARVLARMGYVFANQREFALSLFYYTPAQIIFGQLGFKFDFLDVCQHMIASYIGTLEFNKAEEILYQCQDLLLEYENSSIASEVYLKKALIYSMVGDFEAFNNAFQEADNALKKTSDNSFERERFIQKKVELLLNLILALILRDESEEKIQQPFTEIQKNIIKGSKQDEWLQSIQDTAGRNTKKLQHPKLKEEIERYWKKKKLAV